MRVRGLVFVLVAVLAAFSGGSRGALVGRAQTPALRGAIGCDGRGQQIPFPIAPLGADTGPLPGELLQTVMPNAALDVSQPRLAATCQAVFEDLGRTDGDPFALEAGRVSFTVEGPGLIVEGQGQTFGVGCGEPGTPASCRGAELRAGGQQSSTVTATAALTVHLVLLPGALLAPAATPGGIVVHATYQPASGADAATVSSAIDLLPPAYRLILTRDRPVIGSGPSEAVALTAHLRRSVPNLCAAVGAGPYLVCQELRSEPGAMGVEPGTVTFTTSLGAFVNLQQSIDAGCGGTAGAGAALVVPAAQEDQAFPMPCSTVSVRLSPSGLGGDAVLTATFSGALTGSVAADQTTLTIAPEAATITLGGGCTPLRVPPGLPPNSPVSQLVESVGPARAVYAIWRRTDETASGWEAVYLRDDDRPLDVGTVNPGDLISVCVDAVARFPLG